MTERLDRIEAILLETATIQRSNSKAIEALSTQVSAMGERLETNMESFTQVVNDAMAAQDERQQSTDAQIQSLIDESRFSRLNAERDRATFTEALQSLLGQIVGRLNDIWGKLAS